MSIILIGLNVIGGATVLFRIVAPLTKTQLDNKVLRALELILKYVSLNKENKTLTIKVSK